MSGVERIAIDEENCLLYRRTPWDERAFEVPTSEVLECRSQNSEKADRLLALWHERDAIEGVRFTCTRIDAGDKVLRVALENGGHYYAETSFALSKADIRTAPPAVAPRFLLPLEIPRDGDFEQIREIARDDFDYSRFHEDPHVDPARARRRYFNWIDDLARQNREFLIYRMSGEVAAFHVQGIQGETAELILTGTRRKRSMLALPFWASVLEELRKRGIREGRTMISAANLGVVNLYRALAFRFDRTLLGYHLWYGGPET